jgi:hypothetical protein
VSPEQPNAKPAGAFGGLEASALSGAITDVRCGGP